MPSNKQSVTDQNHNGVPSIDKAFASLWTDETFHDVTLHSADGMAMPANRYALASRSQFFKKMFFGGFQEARTNTVKIGFSGVVLKAVLEYLHTNNTELLVKKPKTTEEATLENFQLVTSLAKAAAYFDLPELGQLTEETTQSYLKVQPSHWLVVLQTTAAPPPLSSPSSSPLQEQEEDIPIELVKIAFRQFFSHDNQQLMASFLETTNASALKSILQDSRCMSPVSALVAFKLIEEWGSFGGDDEEEQSGNATRQQEAMKLIAEHVTLADIPPSMLSTKVKQSGLVTEQQLISAFTSQAFRLEETNVFLQWKRSRSKLFTNRDYVWKGDCIDCEPMVAGKHQWRIQIKRACVNQFVLVGVVSAAKVREFMAGNVRIAEPWVLYGHQAFREGSLVKLTLNLRADDEKNGTLSISVNERTCETFRNLHEKLDDGGFVPVVAGKYAGDAFELVDKSQV